MFHLQGHSKDFWYNMGYASKRLEMDFHLHTMGFNAFQLSWKMFLNLVFLSVRRSVRSLTLVNILQMSWNLSTLFLSVTTWAILKMVYMGLTVHLQRHTNVFWYITAYEGKTFKAYSNTIIDYKCNKTKVYHSDSQKYASYKKRCKYYNYFLYRLIQKFSDPMGGNV